MAYFESITAGRGGLDGYNQALNNQRYANLLLNESMGNFANTMANAGSLFDNAIIREEALKYQRMRDLANDKKQAEAFELQKRQAEQSMDFAKRQQAMNEEMHKQNKRLNDLKTQSLAQEVKFSKQQQDWLMKAKQSAKANVSVTNNNAMKTPTTNALNTLGTQATPITQNNNKKTITKEEFQAVYANPMFRF
ncbi:putative DNA repair protein [Helicobacter phage phiHP33]|uniref:putative DNA repair protein n=1 Tax=Helicobacter phage phiHP33 TaxID=1069378 RepID=UPI00023907CF|nr:putative DNA repair protein [Helicobacter phage phiHP33]AET85177.1 putative DNA repair protein [Helicobacter phage phiHP33]